MKRKLMILILFLVLILIMFVSIFNQKRFLFEEGNTIVGIFKYDDENINVIFSDEDIAVLHEIFNGKKVYKENGLSCGFSEDVSIIINEDKKFLFALDDCPYVYYENEKKYFILNDSENEKLKEILKKYGFHFPCI